MNQRRISDATLRVRDVIYDGLLLRQGQVLTEEVARERANNLATAILEVLAQMAEQAKATDEPPPVRFARAFGDCAAGVGDGMVDAHGDDDWRSEGRIR